MERRVGVLTIAWGLEILVFTPCTAERRQLGWLSCLMTMTNYF